MDVPKLAIEVFHKSILVRLVRLDEPRLDLVHPGPEKLSLG
jgi:hypothetical protein